MARLFDGATLVIESNLNNAIIDAINGNENEILKALTNSSSNIKFKQAYAFTSNAENYTNITGKIINASMDTSIFDLYVGFIPVNSYITDGYRGANYPFKVLYTPTGESTEIPLISIRQNSKMPLMSFASIFNNNVNTWCYFEAKYILS